MLLMNGQRDRGTHGQHENSIPPTNTVFQGMKWVFSNTGTAPGSHVFQ